MLFDEIFSLLMMLSSQHCPIKPCIGHTRWLVTYVTVRFFFFFTFLCLPTFTKQAHMVSLFLTNSCVRDRTFPHLIDSEFIQPTKLEMQKILDKRVLQIEGQHKNLTLCQV